MRDTGQLEQNIMQGAVDALQTGRKEGEPDLDKENKPPQTQVGGLEDSGVPSPSGSWGLLLKSPRTPRMATPTSARRGCRFPSLDEAHRNITGRSATSTSTVHTIGSSSSLGTVNGNITVGGRFEARLRSETRPRKHSITILDNAVSLDPAIANNPNDLKAIPLEDLTPSGARLSIVSESREQARRSRSASVEVGRRYSNSQSEDPSAPAILSLSSSPSPPHEAAHQPISMSAARSVSTFDQIYEQYNLASSTGATPDPESGPLNAGISSPPGNSCSSSHSPERLGDLCDLRSRAAARCGFRAEDGGHGSNLNDCGSRGQDPFNSSEYVLSADDEPERDQQTHPLPSRFAPGDAPNFSLPRIPHVADSRSVRPPSAYFSTSHRLSHRQSSSSGFSDSQILLNADFGSDGLVSPPLRPREPANWTKTRKSNLSAGATSVGATTESDGDPFEYDKESYGTYLVFRNEREVSAALQRVSTDSRHSRVAFDSPIRSPPKRALRPPPIPEHPALTGGKISAFAACGFLDPAAIKSTWDLDQSHCTVKVPVLPPPSTGPTARKDPANETMKPMTLIEQKMFYAEAEEERQRETNHRSSAQFASDKDEWETVPTLRGPNTYNNLGVSAARLRNIIDSRMKTVGSSIADVSDDEYSLYRVPFDEKGSTEHILQHPERGDSGQGFHLRRLRETDMPVFVPKQRVHRVNGFAQDSLRLFDNERCKNAAVHSPPSLTEKIQTPFGLRNKRMKDRQSPPPSVLGDDHNDRSKFEFRDSGASHYGNTQAGFQDTKQTWTDEERDKDRPTGNRESAGNNTTLSSAEYSDETSHNFSFHLIPLPQAAKIQAVRRASGLEDQTETGSMRPRHPSIASSSKTKDNVLGSPKLPRVPKKVHHRRLPTPLFEPWMRPRATSSAAEPHKCPHESSQLSALSSGLDSSPEGGPWGIFGRDNGVPAFGASPVKKARASRRPFRGESSQAPRLCPWERRRHPLRSTRSDPSLRAVAYPGWPPGSLPLSYISHEGRRKQCRWFLMMLAASIFPFLSVLVYFGHFDSALSWYSRGEVHSLTPLQRRVILVMMVLQFFIWPPVLVIVVRKLSGRF